VLELVVREIVKREHIHIYFLNRPTLRFFVQF
jgi:hypothetical protein